MKSVGKLSEYLTNWSEELERKLIKAQEETAEKIWGQVVETAPVRSGTYITSIKKSDTKVEKNKITTEVYTDLLVGGDNPKWSKVPLGCLLEWGTGIKGQGSNSYPHGYGYRQTPWCYYDEYLHQWVTTDGMIARPHFQPALEMNKEEYLKRIKECINE